VTARVGLGCGGLMRDPSRKSRQRLLATALDVGITHFDVARMYGLGAAETEVGRFARGRRDQIVIATKFGIEANAPSRLVALVQGPARRLVARYPKLRAYLKHSSESFHQRRYDARAARESLDASLTALGSDYVDLFFVHDPLPTDSLDLQEICGFLDDEQRAGRIRAWGIAGEQEPCVELREAMSPGAVLQVRDDVFNALPDGARGLGPTITFGVLAGALNRITTHVSSSAGLRERWLSETGVDFASPGLVAKLLIRDAFARNRDGAVLISTTRPERLQGLVDLASVGADEMQLQALRRLAGESAARRELHSDG
jgi:D-threo-aldose 1-dehydrogenase